MNRTGAIRTDALALSICAALTAGVYLAAVRPTLGSQARASENYAQYQTRSRQSDELARKASELEASLAVLKKKLDQSPVRLRSIADVNGVLDEIAKLAAARGVTIDQISSGEALQGTVLAMAPIRLSAAGSFSDVLGFLADLERTHPEVATLRFSIDADREGDPATPQNSGAGGSRTRLVMSLEWYAEPAGAGVKASGKSAGTPAR
jgi:Tfp pilus assembly protein PilO